MKVITTFWSEEKFEFDRLLYIRGNTQEIMFEADLRDSFASYQFFKQISKFVQSKSILNIYGSEDYCQFAVVKDNKITPIKWFDLIIDEKVTLSHDIAFSTTLIKRNNLIIPFGNFPIGFYQKHKKMAKYREFNIKSRAYKYMANQIKKSF